MKLVFNKANGLNRSPYTGWKDESYKLKAFDETLIYKAIRNDHFSVQFSKFETNNGEMIHLWIRSLAKKELTWHQKQEIKNEVIGKDRCAIEMFPAEKNNIGHQDMYHLYVFPQGFEPTFGLHTKQETA